MIGFFNQLNVFKKNNDKQNLYRGISDVTCNAINFSANSLYNSSLASLDGIIASSPIYTLDGQERQITIRTYK